MAEHFELRDARAVGALGESQVVRIHVHHRLDD